MQEWFSNITKNKEEEVFSIAPDFNSEKEKAVSEAPSMSNKQEPITELSPSYKIKGFSAVKQEEKNFPYALVAGVVIVPIMALFIIGALSNKNSKNSKVPFLKQTLESKYFSMTYPPDYIVQSVVDKRVPFLEKHDLTSTRDGQKTLSLVIKDVKFDYEADNNTAVKARRENSTLYEELSIEIKGKQGFHFKRKEDNFEHLIVFIDRKNSVLYEILFSSPSNMAANTGLENELNDMLKSIVFF